jgi:hypothetical protein
MASMPYFVSLVLGIDEQHNTWTNVFVEMYICSYLGPRDEVRRCRSTDDIIVTCVGASEAPGQKLKKLLSSNQPTLKKMNPSVQSA